MELFPSTNGIYLSDVPEVQPGALICDQFDANGEPVESPLKRRLDDPYPVASFSEFGPTDRDNEADYLREDPSRRKLFRPEGASAATQPAPIISQASLALVSKQATDSAKPMPKGASRFKQTAPAPKALAKRRQIINNSLVNIGKVFKSISNAMSTLYNLMEFLPVTITNITEIFDAYEQLSPSGTHISMLDALLTKAIENREVEEEKLKKGEIELNLISAKRLALESKTTESAANAQQLDDFIQMLGNDRLPKPEKRSWRNLLTSGSGREPLGANPDTSATNNGIDETLHLIHSTEPMDAHSGPPQCVIEAIWHASLLYPEAAIDYLSKFPAPRIRDRIRLLFRPYLDSLKNPPNAPSQSWSTLLCEFLNGGKYLHAIRVLREHMDLNTAPALLTLVKFDAAFDAIRDALEYCRPGFMDVDPDSPERHRLRAIAVKDIINDQALFTHHVEALTPDDRVAFIVVCGELYPDISYIRSLKHRTTELLGNASSSEGEAFHANQPFSDSQPLHPESMHLEPETAGFAEYSTFPGPDPHTENSLPLYPPNPIDEEVVPADHQGPEPPSSQILPDQSAPDVPMPIVTSSKTEVVDSDYEDFIAPLPKRIA